uniref:Methyltransferase FkbM domain-containing protein n=1 Tax=viral metagenome TaxID=1070528 RepID=A0A6C0KR94_9ZZZZ
MDILHFLKVYEFNNKCRLGENEDGGYIIGLLEGRYDCYISAGIGGEESFSRDFINIYNMNKFNSYAFDGTIDNYPYQYTENITFMKKNINCFKDENNADLSFLTNKYNNIFLKMDIEGGEFPWLLNIGLDKLSKFKQIVIEIHGLTDDSWDTNYNEKIKCLEKLSITHYLIHAHGNNYAKVINGTPSVIELTYVNKNYFKQEPKLNSQNFPIKDLDFPNNPSADDIKLDFYPFLN